jgi:hypothetical protein
MEGYFGKVVGESSDIPLHTKEPLPGLTWQGFFQPSMVGVR